MKWLRITGIFVAIILTLLSAQSIVAETSEDVVVTAAGYICDIPGGFTLTYISDREVGISWTKGEDAVNTMIRASYGQAPETITDGYLVYYGNGEYCSDTAMNFDEFLGKIYYAAWSENENGVFTQEYASGEMEGITVLLIFLGGFGGIFLILAFAFRQMVLAFFAGLVFLGLSIVGWTNTLENYDTYWLIGVLGILALLVCFVMGFIIQRMAVKESSLRTRRYNKEFPPQKVLTEEETYSQDLDREIGESRRARTAKRARDIMERYR